MLSIPQLRAALFMCLSLMVLLMSLYQLSLPQGPRYLIWLLQVLPLLIFFPGIYQMRRRTCQWLSFVILLYFIRATQNVFSAQPGLFDALLLVSSVTIFILCVMASRALLPKAAPPTPSKVDN